MTNFDGGEQHRLLGTRRPGRRALVGATAGVVALTASVTLAPAALARTAHRPKTAMVVQVVNRAPFGPMLATVGGASLYTTPASCTGGCLTIWPPLVMPKGAKIPTGASGLGTAKLKPRHHQVTFDGKRLYTFDGDTGNSVNGNGVGGFMVATVP